MVPSTCQLCFSQKPQLRTPSGSHVKPAFLKRLFPRVVTSNTFVKTLCFRAVLCSQQNCQEGTEISPTPPSLPRSTSHHSGVFPTICEAPRSPPAPESMLTSRGCLVLDVGRVGTDMFPHVSTAGLRRIVRGRLTGSALRSACVSCPSLAATDPFTVLWSCLFPGVPQLESCSMEPFVFPYHVIVLMKFLFIKKLFGGAPGGLRQ